MARNIADSRLGVALTKCYFCGEGSTILINTKLTEAHAAAVDELDRKVIDMEPCTKCAGYMKQGVIIITIDEKKSDEGWNKPPPPEYDRQGRKLQANWMPNPYRAGGWFVVKDEAVRRMLGENGALLVFALGHRWMFMEHEAAEKLGLLDAAKDAPQG